MTTSAPLLTVLSFVVCLSLTCCGQSDKSLGQLDKNCDEQISDETAQRLNVELEAFQDELISADIIEDGTGKSYWKAFENIVKTNDFKHQLKSEMPALTSVDNTTLNVCFYRLLAVEDGKVITQRHLDAAKEITGEYENVSPSAVAERITQNLSPQDFDQEVFRKLALLAFYRMSTIEPISVLGIPIEYETEDRNISALTIELNDKSELIIDNKKVAFEDLKKIVGDYLDSNGENHKIEIVAARSASYEAFSRIKDDIDACYTSKVGLTKNVVVKENKY